MIVLIVVGGVLVLGGGACVVVGALALMGVGVDGEPEPPPVATTASPPATAAPAPAPAPAATADDEGEGEGEAPSGKATAGNTGATWFCNASASVRVCGFAGACNYQMVFGNGFGKDRFLASQQAKNACEAQARAKGTSAVCVVQCSVR